MSKKQLIVCIITLAISVSLFDSYMSIQSLTHYWSYCQVSEKTSKSNLIEMFVVTDSSRPRLISRSYLPFCPDTKVKVGKDPKDTWTKMLSQIHRVTDSGAEGIVEQYPTMRSLLMAYEKNPLGGERLLTESKVCAEFLGVISSFMLTSTQVNHRIDGQKTIEGRGHDKLGLALSRRVHTILCGTDHLALVVKDK